MRSDYVEAEKVIKVKHPLMAAIDEANTLDAFIERVNEMKINNEINTQLNCGYYYSRAVGAYYQQFEYPLHYAVTRNKAFLVPYLKHRGATDPENDPLLSYAISRVSDINAIETIYEAGFKKIYLDDLSYSKTTDIFNYIHKITFNHSLLDIAKGVDENAQKEYLNKLVTDYRSSAKPEFLKAIRESHELKSVLKMNLLLGIENPIVTFLRSSKRDNKIRNTKSYGKLMGMLNSHHFLDSDFIQLREQLLTGMNSDGFEPNPALAALYLSHINATADDYKIFEDHLLKPFGDKYDPKMQATLRNLLSHDGLEKTALELLKNNIKSIVSRRHEAYGEYKQSISADTESPLRDIIRTGQNSRRDKDTTSYNTLKKFSFFADSVRPVSLAAYGAPETLVQVYSNK